jgi:hypothetical protein
LTCSAPAHERVDGDAEEDGERWEESVIKPAHHCRESYDAKQNDKNGGKTTNYGNHCADDAGA